MVKATTGSKKASILFPFQVVRSLVVQTNVRESMDLFVLHRYMQKWVKR
jgi:hypothetical protein